MAPNTGNKYQHGTKCLTHVNLWDPREDPNPSTTPRSYPISKRKVRRGVNTGSMPPMTVRNTVLTAKERATAPRHTASSYARPLAWPSPPPGLRMSPGRAIYVPGPELPRPRSKFSRAARTGHRARRAGSRWPEGTATGGHGTDLAGQTNTKLGSPRQEACALTSALEDRGRVRRLGSPGPAEAGRISPCAGARLAPGTARLWVWVYYFCTATKSPCWDRRESVFF